MAKQFGTHTLQGTVGDVTYKMTKNGNKAFKRRVISKADRLANTNLDVIRQQAAEFGKAIKAASLVRNAFNSLVRKSHDKRFANRLSSLMNKVIKADPINSRGQRNVLDGDLHLLEKFEFNLGTALASSLSAPYTLMVDRAEGTATFSSASFAPKANLKYPPTATLFKMGMGAALIDFETGISEHVFAESGYLPLGDDPSQPIHLSVRFTPGSTLPLFVVLRLDFGLVELNGREKSIDNNAFTVCTLVKVDTGG